MRFGAYFKTKYYKLHNLAKGNFYSEKCKNL
jgi:hypothetical protein